MEKLYEQLGQPSVVGLSSSVLSREPSTPENIVGSAEFFRAAPGLLTRGISIIGYTDSFRIKTPEALSANGDRYFFLGSKASTLRISGHLGASSIRFAPVSSSFLVLSTSHQQKQSGGF